MILLVDFHVHFILLLKRAHLKSSSVKKDRSRRILGGTGGGGVRGADAPLCPPLQRGWSFKIGFLKDFANFRAPPVDASDAISFLSEPFSLPRPQFQHFATTILSLIFSSCLVMLMVKVVLHLLKSNYRCS